MDASDQCPAHAPEFARTILCYAAFTQSFACTARVTNSEIAFSVASGASRCGEWRAPGNSATSTGQ